MRNDMMKRTGAVLGALMIAAAMSGCSIFGYELPFGNDTKETTAAQTESAQDESTAETTAEAAVKTESEEENSDTGNGDDMTDEHNTNKKADKLEITVSEDKYIVDNSTMTLDEVKKLIDDNEGAAVVITDDNASQNAYKDLTSYLMEKKTEFTEEQTV